MNRIIKSLFRFRKDDSGVALLYVTMTLPVMIALTSFAIDLGYVWYVKTRLQVAADMGALAGASKLYTDNADAVKNLSKDYVDYNLTDLTAGGRITATRAPEIKCLDTIKAMGLTCSSLSGGNSLKVTVTAQAPLFFASTLGFNTMTLSAVSMVSGGGSSPPPLNVAIILDATGSMSSSLGTACGTLLNPTKIQCASLAAKTLLSKLWASVDQVALYTYPAYDANSKNVFSCSGGSGSANSISYQTGASPNYQMFGFNNSYMDGGSPPTGGLITTNPMVKALGRSATANSSPSDSTTCAGFAVSGLGGQGTSIADAIAQAQRDLLAANVALVARGEPKRQNVMIILSDGDANANVGSGSNNPFLVGSNSPPNTAPGWTIDVPLQMDQCQGAVAVADAAAAPGANGETWVYAVAFSAPAAARGSCWSDRPVTSVINTSGPFTPTSNTWSCSSSRRCAPQAAATRTTWNVAAVASSRQVATSTTGTLVTTCNRSAGSSSGSCTTTMTPTRIQTDTYDLSRYDTTACKTMQDIASDPSKFYSTDGGNSSNGRCPSAANPNFTDLVAIFNNVAASIMKKRRIPNKTT